MAFNLAITSKKGMLSLAISQKLLQLLSSKLHNKLDCPQIRIAMMILERNSGEMM